MTGDKSVTTTSALCSRGQIQSEVCISQLRESQLEGQRQTTLLQNRQVVVTIAIHTTEDSSITLLRAEGIHLSKLHPGMQ